MIDTDKFVQLVALAVVSAGLAIGVLLVVFLDGVN